MTRNPKWGGARVNRSALARPTVRRVELDEDVADMIRAGCIVRHGTAGKTEVAQYVNELVRAALAPKPQA